MGRFGVGRSASAFSLSARSPLPSLFYLGRKQEAQGPEDDAAQNEATDKAASVPAFGAVVWRKGVKEREGWEGKFGAGQRQRRGVPNQTTAPHFHAHRAVTARPRGAAVRGAARPLREVRRARMVGGWAAV